MGKKEQQQPGGHRIDPYSTQTAVGVPGLRKIMPRYIVKDSLLQESKKGRVPGEKRLQARRGAARSTGSSSPADKVLDLGAAPGGWLQVESARRG